MKLISFLGGIALGATGAALLEYSQRQGFLSGNFRKMAQLKAPLQERKVSILRRNILR